MKSEFYANKTESNRTKSGQNKKWNRTKSESLKTLLNSRKQSRTKTNNATVMGKNATVKTTSATVKVSATQKVVMELFSGNGKLTAEEMAKILAKV